MFVDFNEFSNLISKAGDSCIKGYHIENGIISIHLTLEDDSDFLMEFKSNYCFAGELSKLDIENTGILQCVKIDKYLHVENGFYMYPKSFSDLMTLRKHNLTLAIGNLAKEYDYVVNYSGHRSIISFLINSNDLIKIVEA